MTRVEVKLDSLLQRLDSFVSAGQGDNFDCIEQDVPIPVTAPQDVFRRTHRAAHSHQSESADVLQDGASVNTASHLPSETAVVADLYMTWCHAQPLALFQPSTFAENLSRQADELKLAISALALRYPPSCPRLPQERLDERASTAHRMAHDKITAGDVELSSMQTLCLLSLIDLSANRVARAQYNLAMARHLGEVMRCAGDNPTQSDYANCIWSIVVLLRLQGSVVSHLAPSISTASAFREDYKWSPEPAMYSDANGECQMDSGILRFTAHLYRVWYSARVYAAQETDSAVAAPWLPNSDFSKVMIEHLELDANVPRKYRYSMNDFLGLDTESLDRNRAYWMPWLMMQVIYASIPCLLNHPYLLSRRLRHYRRAMPQSFIQQSYEQLMRHAGWIMHFLDVFQAKGCHVSDPAISHCVAVVATIHLQHSFVTDKVCRDRSTAGFDKCLRFLQSVAPSSCFVAAMLENLRDLRDSVQRRARHIKPSTAWSMDTSLLGRVLIFETAGHRKSSPDTSIRGQSLTLKTNSTACDDAADSEYDLIGTSGISGHRTVLNDNPLNAPGRSEEPTCSIVPMGDDRSLFPETIGAEVLDSIGGLEEDYSPLMHAEDYEKALQHWLDLEAT